jgi:predicted nucleic acid-binding protein
LAQQLKNAVVLIDERKGRRVAERVYGLRILGTGGLLLRAKTVGLIAGVQSCLSAMKANGYYLGDRLVRAVCQAAGESMSL